MPQLNLLFSFINWIKFIKASEIEGTIEHPNPRPYSRSSLSLFCFIRNSVIWNQVQVTLTSSEKSFYYCLYLLEILLKWTVLEDHRIHFVVQKPIFWFVKLYIRSSNPCFLLQFCLYFGFAVSVFEEAYLKQHNMFRQNLLLNMEKWLRSLANTFLIIHFKNKIERCWGMICAI